MRRSGLLFCPSLDGGGSTYVRASRHGDRLWPGKRDPHTLFPVGIVVRLFPRRYCKHLQYRRRSRGHGGSDSDDHGDPRLLLGPFLCGCDPGSIVVDLLPNHGANF